MKTFKGIAVNQFGSFQGKVTFDINNVGHIYCTESTSPDDFAQLIKHKAFITKRGSMLSHAAILSRELGIPCIVGVKNLELNEGDEIIMYQNGTIINENTTK